MSGTAINDRLLPANVNLLQPGSRFFRLSDALNYQVAALQASIGTLQPQITENATNITTLQGQVATLQAQVQVLQQFMRSFDYQQIEISTGTIFLDQRTIYRRSFVINNALNTGLNVFTFPHLVPAISYIVNIQAMAAQAGGQQLPITFLNVAQFPNLQTGLSCWADTTNLYIAVGATTFVGYQVLATLWYTATNR